MNWSPEVRARLIDENGTEDVHAAIDEIDRLEGELEAWEAGAGNALRMRIEDLENKVFNLRACVDGAHEPDTNLACRWCGKVWT